MTENGDISREEARQEAARVLVEGQQMARRVAQKQRGTLLPTTREGAALGKLIANPNEFWAYAATDRTNGDGDTVGAIALATRLASAKLAGGDTGFVRESLVGQSQWLGVVAVNMMTRADEAKTEHAIPFIKLALAAQRQAAQCLASAAAIDRLSGEITVGDG